MDLISKAIFYYSLTGNTKAIIENVEGFDVYDIEIPTNEFINYDILIIGMPSYGRGTPHKKTWNFIRELIKVKDKKIGLFGSGNTIYGDYYGGAIDFLERELSKRNEILFKFKFESYPLDEDRITFENLVKTVGVNKNETN